MYTLALTVISSYFSCQQKQTLSYQSCELCSIQMSHFVLLSQIRGTPTTSFIFHTYFLSTDIHTFFPNLFIYPNEYTSTSYACSISCFEHMRIVNILTSKPTQLCCVETFQEDVGTPLYSPDLMLKLISFEQLDIAQGMF